MQEEILRELKSIEAKDDIRIVYACESGSRAWGFPSADSDYDVRFLYVRPVDWYLSIDEKRDVIEQPINEGLDINGWDLKKALRLFRKSNPPLWEWLFSPIKYLEPYAIAAKMRTLAADVYAPAACFHHYLHMARGNAREYLKGETVCTKKYFYVLRPVLAMQWIEAGLGVVPTNFNTLVERLVKEAPLKTEIERLLKAKRAGDELDKGPRIAPISEFIESELERWQSQKLAVPRRQRPAIDLDLLFRESLSEVWGALT